MAIQPSNTLPDLLCDRAALTSDAVAIRYKRKGIWHALTWSRFHDRVRRCALGLSRVGFAAGDRLLLIGEACPEWLVADLAAQWLGGVSVTPYPDGSEGDVVRAMAQAQAQLAVVDTSDRKRLCDLRSLPSLWLRNEPGLDGASIEDLSLGDLLGEGPMPDAVATVAFTAGAGGECRPVPLTHAAIIARARQVSDFLNHGQAVDAFCQVPFAHVAERIATSAAHLVAGGVLTFGERTDTVAGDLKDVTPGQLSALAWQWDRLAQGLILKMRDASSWNRASFRSMLDRSGGLAAIPMRWALRRHLGIAGIRRLVCHGASVKPETERLFSALGCPLLSTYGTTEGCGWSLVRSGETSWSALPGETCRVAPDGELFVGVEALATCDMASDATGRIELLGRKPGSGDRSDVAVAAAERELARSTLIAHAAVTRCGSLARAIVAIDPDAVGDWARREGHRYSSVQSLATHEGVVTLITSEVLQVVRRHFADGVQAEVRILSDQLRREDGTLTPTGTLRRQALLDAFEHAGAPREREMSDALPG
jgi:long-chain acyl-CoA synthetase